MYHIAQTTKIMQHHAPKIEQIMSTREAVIYEVVFLSIFEMVLFHFLILYMYAAFSENMTLLMRKTK